MCASVGCWHVHHCPLPLLKDGDVLQRSRKKTSPFITITTAFLFLLVTVFLLYCGFGGYQDILEAKYQAFCWICGGYILVMGVVAIEGVAVGAIRPVSPKVIFRHISWPQRFALIYLVFTWVSALLSPHFPDTIIGVSRYEGALTITIYVLCFLLVSVYGRASRELMCAFGVATTLFGILCLVQLMGYNPLELYPAGYNYADAYQEYAGAYLGTIGNVDLVAAFLCIAIPLLGVGLFRLPGKGRFALAIPLVLSLAVLFKMWVLAGIVGVFGGGVIVFLVVTPVPPKRRKQLALAAMGLAIAVLLAIYAYDAGTGMLHELHEILHGNLDTDFGSGRIYIWENVLSKTPGHFFLGAGPDTMLHAQFEPFMRYHETSGGMIVSQIDVAHNEYLNILYHQGIFALLAYLLLLLSLAKQWINQANNPIAAMLGGAAVCYCVQAFFGFSMCITVPFFWVVLGLLEGCGRGKAIGGQKQCGRKSSV